MFKLRLQWPSRRTVRSTYVYTMVCLGRNLGAYIRPIIMPSSIDVVIASHAHVQISRREQHH